MHPATDKVASFHAPGFRDRDKIRRKEAGLEGIAVECDRPVFPDQRDAAACAPLPIVARAREFVVPSP